MGDEDIKEIRREIKEIHEKLTILVTKEEMRPCKSHSEVIEDLSNFKTRYETVRLFVLSVVIIAAALLTIIYNFQRIDHPAQATTIQTK